MGETDPPFERWKPGSDAAREAERRLARAETLVPASPLTFEGEIEAFGNLARTAKRGTGWRRRVAYAIAVISLAPFAIGIVMGLISVAQGL